jgi:micrococcal nuclease
MSVLLAACQTTVALPSSTTEPTRGPSPTVETAEPTPVITLLPAFGEGPQGLTVEALLVGIVDGDTIKVEINGVAYSLRYIGIDAPERGLAHADEATAADQRLVGGATVFLESDVSNTDQFDRLLRYVWLAQGSGWLLVNRELVRLGAAVAKAYPPDTTNQTLFDTAQIEALAAGVGVWTATPVPIVQFVATPKPAGNCDPAYPTVCIPPPPPDLDCGDITFRRFTVLPPDPHGFDGNDNDGIGCESG